MRLNSPITRSGSGCRIPAESATASPHSALTGSPCKIGTRGPPMRRGKRCSLLFQQDRQPPQSPLSPPCLKAGPSGPTAVGSPAFALLACLPFLQLQHLVHDTILPRRLGAHIVVAL